jgi:hypothetical protein
MVMNVNLPWQVKNCICHDNKNEELTMRDSYIFHVSKKDENAIAKNKNSKIFH